MTAAARMKAAVWRALLWCWDAAVATFDWIRFGSR